MVVETGCLCPSGQGGCHCVKINTIEKPGAGSDCVKRIFNFSHRIVRAEANIPVNIISTTGTILCEPKGGDILFCLTDFDHPEVLAYMFLNGKWSDPTDVVHTIFPGCEFHVSDEHMYAVLLDQRILTPAQFHRELVAKMFG